MGTLTAVSLCLEVLVNRVYTRSSISWFLISKNKLLDLATLHGRSRNQRHDRWPVNGQLTVDFHFLSVHGQLSKYNRTAVSVGPLTRRYKTRHQTLMANENSEINQVLKYNGR